MKHFFSRYRIICLIIFAGAFLRLLYVLYPLNPLFNDNAKNAWEATHFFDQFGWQTILKIPSHLEIFFLTLSFKSFGANTFSYFLFSIFQYLVFAVIFFLTIRNFSNQKTAFLATVFLSFAPPLFIFNSLMWSGHFRGVLFSWFLFYLFSLFSRRESLKMFLIFTFFGGVSIAVGKLTPALSFLVCLIFLLLKKRNIFSFKNLIWGLCFFTLGIILFFDFSLAREPVIYGSLANANFYNFNFFFLKKLARVAEVSFFVWSKNNSYNLFFGMQNQFSHFIYLFIFLFSTLIFGINFLKKKNQFDFILIVYLISFCLIFAFVNLSHGITRYYLPVLPVLIYFWAKAMVYLLNLKNNFIKFFAVLLIIFTFSFSLFDNLHFYKSSYQPFFDIIDFSEKNDINAIFTDYFLQFALIFYSQEKISASSPIIPDVYKGSIWDEKVKNAEEISFLTEGDDCLLEKYLSEKKIGFRKKKFNSLTFYYQLSSRLSPSQYLSLKSGL